MRPNLIRVLLAFCATLAVNTAHAGSVRALNLVEMTDRADLIFTGRVTGKRADWNADRTRIFTHVTFEVETYLKGGTGARSVTVRLLGGQVGRYLARVPGTPQFTVGEEVLLFCAGEQARMPTVLGLSAGKFTIAKDSAGERILKRDISTLMLANYNTQAREPGDPVRRYRLSEVTARIEERLQ